MFFDKAPPGRKINRRNSLGNAPHPTFIFRPDLFRTGRCISKIVQKVF
jgi:hypothetical protein